MKKEKASAYLSILNFMQLVVLALGTELAREMWKPLPDKNLILLLAVIVFGLAGQGMLLYSKLVNPSKRKK